MKRIIAFFLCFSWFLPTSVISQTSQALTEMQKDFPGLMSLYGDRISDQKAHYIFVVDVSSSMRDYESTVKTNLLQFLNAVPDGDQISLIKMSDESHTGYVGLLKCATLNSDVRSSIKDVVQGFRFNSVGSPEDGSDGFTMTKCVLDAINVVGSNDLTFVYMLTDFEYWTHKYKYDKSREDWASLKSLIPKDKINGMCKYGIELNAGSNLHQNAIFKTELDGIFGKVEYQSVSSAALLSNWFSHIATNVMSVKLNSLLKSDWKNVKESIQSDISLSGNDLSVNLQASETPLASGAEIIMKTDNRNFVPIQLSGSFPGSIQVGNLKLSNDEKSLFPGFKQLGGDKYEATIVLKSPYDDEINRLQGVCGEVAGQGDAVNLKLVESGELPQMKVWSSTLPLWLWCLIILVILAIIASFIYEFFIIKLNRRWMVLVKISATDGTVKRVSLDEATTPIVIGPSGSDLHVQGANWSVKLFTERHNPALFFLKSGYYLVLEQGDFAELQTDNDYDPRTISIGEKTFLYKPGKTGLVTVKIGSKGQNRYQIELN